MKTTLLIVFVAGLWACHKPEIDVLTDANGIITKLPFLWKSSTTLDGGLNSAMSAQHIYKDKFLLTAQRVGADGVKPFGLCFKNVDTGKDTWVWNDRLRSYEGGSVYYYGIYSYQNLLMYNYGPRTYCIDQNTGQTVWKKEWTPGISQIITTDGYGPNFYFTGTPPAAYSQKHFEESVYQGNMASGALQEVVKLPVLPGKVWHDPSGYDLLSTGRHIMPFVQGSDTLLLISYDLPDPRPAYTADASGYLGLYNLSLHKWVYDQMPMVNADEAGGGNFPIIVGDRVYYAINMWVGCFELMTGKRIWMKRITQASLFSDMIYAEGKLLANGQDAKLYCLDPQTGNIIWTQRSSGIGSSLHYQDGVVYYIASQNLLATEVATGKLLWKLACPDSYTENRPDSWFQGFVTGLPATGGKQGRIFASTNLNVYCFDAAK